MDPTRFITTPENRFAYGEQVLRTWQAWWVLPSDRSRPVSTLVTLVGWSLAQLTHGLYEALVGRFTEALAHGQATPEDLWAARVAQQEADQWKTSAWYRFSGGATLHELWVNDWPTDVSLPRQMERRYAYTSAYVVQGVVATITGSVVGTHMDRRR